MTDTGTGLQSSLKKQVTDQLLHMAAAIVVLSPLIIHPAFYTAIWAGFGCGMIREVTQRGDPVKLQNFTYSLKSGGSLLDITFWTVGSAVAWFLFH